MQQRVSGNCVLPLALWGSQPPTHDITCLIGTPDGRFILTGDTEGKIVVWQTSNIYADDFQMYSKWMLLCHRNSLVGMAMAGGGKDSLRPYVVSVSDIGDMALWDIEEGRCVEYVRDSRYLHTQVRECEVEGQIYNRLYCCGRYPEVTVYDALHLTLLFTLVSQPTQVDWFTAVTMFHHAEQKNDVFLAVSLSGTVTLWTVNPNDKLKGSILAEESKFIGCSNALSICCCPSSPRSVLLVCQYFWKIYDAMDWSVLTTQKCNQSEPFIGGEFISADSVVLYAMSGRAFIYKLPPTCLRGRVSIPRFSSPPTLFRRDSTQQQLNSPHLFCIFEMPRAWKYDPMSLKLRCKRFLWFHSHISVLASEFAGKGKMSPLPGIAAASQSHSNIATRFIGANSRGDLLFYSIPHQQPLAASSMENTNQGTVSILPSRVHCLDQYWRDEMTTDLLTPFQPLSENHVTNSELGNVASVICPPRRLVLTAACIIQNGGRIALGLDSGEVLIVPLVDLLSTLYFTDADVGLDHVRLVGHQGAVTCLLHPHSTNLGGHTNNPSHPFFTAHSDLPDSGGGAFKPLYDPDYLLSTSMDFSVRLWNIASGLQLAVFHSHAAPVIALHTVPMKVGTPSQATGCVVSVGEDHSVSILSLREKKLVLHCAHQTSPVLCLGWRAVDDFLLISCLDGTVYVWEMGSGYLDRQECGQQADDVFDNCPVYTRIRNSRGTLLLPHLKLTRGTHRESHFRSLILPPTRLLCCSFSTLTSSSTDTPAPTRAASSFLTGSHFVLCFDVESLVEDLLGQEWRQRAHMHPHLLIGGNTPPAFSSNTSLSLLSATSSASSLPVTNPANAAKRILSSSNLASLQSNTNTANNGGQLGLLDGNSDSLELDQQLVYLLCCLLHPWSLDPGVDKALRDSLGFISPPYLLPQLGSRSGKVNFSSSSPSSPSPSATSTGTRPHWGLLSRHNALALLMPGWHKLSLPRSAGPAVASLSMAASRHMLEPEWNVGHCLSTVRFTSAMALVQCMLNISDESLSMWDKNCITRTINREDGIWSCEQRVLQKDLLQRSLGVRKSAAAGGGGIGSGITKKQVLTLMATTLCTTLPDLLEERRLKQALVQLLAMKWQDRCLQVREAAQTLLHALLDRAGGSERNRMVQQWTNFLPPFATQDSSFVSDQQQQQQMTQMTSVTNAASDGGGNPRDAADQLSIAMFHAVDCAEPGLLCLELDWWIPATFQKLSRTETQRLQGLSIILLGVLGVRYGGSTTTSRQRGSVSLNKGSSQDSGNNGIVDGSYIISGRSAGMGDNTAPTTCIELEGFGVDNYHVARCTCRALTILGQRIAGGDGGVPVGPGGGSGSGLPIQPPVVTMSNHTVTIGSLHHYQAPGVANLQQQQMPGTQVGNASPTHSVLPQQHAGNMLWHGPMRRIALDLLGRGFAVWEPYLDVATLLNTLLYSARDVETLLESLEAGATIPDSVDCAHVARQSLLSIAQARPKAFIVTLSREVLRFNSSGAAGSVPSSGGGVGGSTAMMPSTGSTLMVGGIAYPPLSEDGTTMAGNASANVTGVASSAAQVPVFAARGEIWRCVEILLQKRTQELMDVLAEVVDILLFCVDKVRLREQGLLELCPFLKNVTVISSNLRSHKVIVGGRNGAVAFYDFKVGKYNVSQGHRAQITAVAFNPDGKLAATFSMSDSQLKVWQLTSSGLFGVGGHHVKLLSSHTLPPIGGAPSGMDQHQQHQVDSAFSTTPLHPVGVCSPLWLEWADLRTVQLVGAPGVLCRTKV